MSTRFHPPVNARPSGEVAKSARVAKVFDGQNHVGMLDATAVDISKVARIPQEPFDCVINLRKRLLFSTTSKSEPRLLNQANAVLTMA